MSVPSVPVTSGSPRFIEREVERFLVTHAWFPAGAVLEPHVHDRPTFAVILEGGFDLVFTNPSIRTHALPCSPGTILTEPAGEKHSNHIFSRGASVIVIQPDPGAPGLDVATSRVLDRINHFRHGGIASIGRSVVRELLAADDLASLAVEALALEMLVEAARLGEDDRWAKDTPSWMHRAVDFVHASFRDPLRVADVAEAAGVHPAHLAAGFRRVHKMPVASYIRRLRVDWAAERLLRTDESISAIAYRAGFADQAHLTRTFKRAIGSTPARYRDRRHLPRGHHDRNGGDVSS